MIDPIDATRNYIRGIPVFATLIALDGQVGVISAPALNRRWWASRGDGAFCDGRRIAVSKVDRFEDAQIGYDSVYDFATPDKFLSLVRNAGEPAASATSGSTRWSPRADQRSPSSRRSRGGTWPRCRS